MKTHIVHNNRPELRMNFSEVTFVLQPVLGINLIRLVLTYMSIFDDTDDNNKFLVPVGREHMHEYCNKAFNNYNLGIYVTDRVFDEVRRAWNHKNECTRSFIQNDFCREHEDLSHCAIRYPRIPDVVGNYLESNRRWSHTEIYAAFCKDMEIVQRDFKP